MLNCIIVGGKFDDDGGKPSGYIQKFYTALSAMCPNTKLFNGGYFDMLNTTIFEQFLNGKQVIFWMPDVPNDKEKIVLKIKTNYPHAILITSKNNLEDKYNVLELISRALMTKSNLLLSFRKTVTSNNIEATIYDPLGNCYGQSTDIEQIVTFLMNRIIKLLSFTRVKSVCTSDSVEYPIEKPEAFFSTVQRYADVFHDLIHASNTTRMLGNASFRCENGFPSFKTDTGDIFVTRRNVDKRQISIESFVPVHLLDNECTQMQVRYKGNHKPSVDTPIQLMLYRYYKDIKFMIHSHTYISDKYVKETTANYPIPCGAIEEFYEIVKCVPSRNTYFAQINLLGHGSLVMSSTIERLQNIDYLPRNIPENIIW
jgi:hypothetical protein